MFSHMLSNRMQHTELTYEKRRNSDHIRAQDDYEEAKRIFRKKLQSKLQKENAFLNEAEKELYKAGFCLLVEVNEDKILKTNERTEILNAATDLLTHYQTQEKLPETNQNLFDQKFQTLAKFTKKKMTGNSNRDYPMYISLFMIALGVALIAGSVAAMVASGGAALPLIIATISGTALFITGLTILIACIRKTHTAKSLSNFLSATKNSRKACFFVNHDKQPEPPRPIHNLQTIGFLPRIGCNT